MLRRSSKQPLTTAGSAFGSGLVLEADNREAAAIVRECLPPQWLDGEDTESPMAVQVSTVQQGSYEVRRDGMVAATGSREEVVEALDWIIRGHIATTSPNHIFVHAGTVAYQGRAIVIPGESFSGKTTLVTELVLAGAEYYSDEYAVIDLEGRVHPYPKPLSIRTRDAMAARVNTEADDLGATIGTVPVAVGLVVATQYRSRAQWSPVEMTPSETFLALMSHTYSSLERPEHTMKVLRHATESAVGLRSDRGDARLMIPDLFERMAR